MREKLINEKIETEKEYEICLKKIEKWEDVWYLYTRVERPQDNCRVYSSYHARQLKHLDYLKNRIRRLDEKISIYI